jgi:hypothetical protein
MKYTILLLVVAVFSVTSAIAQQTGATGPVLVSLPKFTMPQGGYGVGGTVMVRVSVNESGEVTNAAFSKGPGPVCGWVTRPDVVVTREAAVALARQAKFAPAMSGGVPVPSTTFVAIEFVPTARSGRSNATKETEMMLGTYSGPVRKLATVPPVPKESKTAIPTVDSTEESKPETVDRVLTIIGSSDSEQRPRVPAGQGASPSDIVKTPDGDTVSGGVLNGKAFSLPKPTYPAAARAVRAAGAVPVQVLIDIDGTVFAAAANGGHPLLQAASVTAACNAKFTPTLLAGQPVKVSGIIVYNYVP